MLRGKAKKITEIKFPKRKALREKSPDGSLSVGLKPTKGFSSPSGFRLRSPSRCSSSAVPVVDGDVRGILLGADVADVANEKKKKFAELKRVE